MRVAVVVIDCERREVPAGAVEQGAAVQRFLFVDNARFLSIVGIVAVQCGLVMAATMHPASPLPLRVLDGVTNYVAVIFFVVSGFLLGERFETAGRMDYLRRRVKKIFIPWLFWFYLQIVSLVAIAMVDGFRLRISLETVRAVGGMILATAASSGFWYVPNLFFAVMVLLVFRRALRSVWLGAALFGVNVFYTVSLYTGWVGARHTEGMFGLVSYMWLGAYLAIHYDRIMGVLRRISVPVAGAVAVAAGLLSLEETHLLAGLHASGPGDVLRMSNQVFSLAVVLLLLRGKTAFWPKFMDVRRQMFGVYLAQTLVMTVISLGIPTLMDLMPVRGAAEMAVLWAVMVVVVFGISLLISQGLAKHRNLGWMVGDLALHRAERRAAQLIQERAMALQGMVMAGLLRPEEDEEEFGEASLA